MLGVRPGLYPLWGFTYLRWWLYRKVLALSPMAMLAGTPLLPPYLRMLGALDALPVPPLSFQFNNRKLIQGFYLGLGAGDPLKVMQLVDKLDSQTRKFKEKSRDHHAKEAQKGQSQAPLQGQPPAQAKNEVAM